MKRKVLSLLLALTLCVGLTIPAMAASDKAIAAADELHELGLFNGVGNNADGTPNYDLDRAPNRMEAVTLLVRLLGKEAEAMAGSWAIPFTDVDDWAMPYVGYAYANGLTSGTSATTFSGTDTVSATQYLTFVLRALGYSSDTDFAWSAAWDLTDELQITNGEYDAASAFTRGDAVIVSANALDVTLKDGSMTLLEAIEQALANVPGGNASKIFTKDGWPEYWFETKMTIEVISPYEAIFTVNYHTYAYMYTARISIGNEKYYDFAYENVYDGSAFCFTEDETFISEGIEYSYPESTEGTITWRVNLAHDFEFNFDMVTDESFSFIVLGS